MVMEDADDHSAGTVIVPLSLLAEVVLKLKEMLRRRVSRKFIQESAIDVGWKYLVACKRIFEVLVTSTGREWKDNEGSKLPAVL
jgi:hypothetical protein